MYACPEPTHGDVSPVIVQDNVTLIRWWGVGPNNVDKLRVINNMFGSGFVLGGSHNSIPQVGVMYTEEAKRL